MTKQEEIRVLTIQAFVDLLRSVHQHPMERESDLVAVEVAGYLRRLNLKDVVIKVDRKLHILVDHHTQARLVKEITDSGYVAVEPLIKE